MLESIELLEVYKKEKMKEILGVSPERITEIPIR
jgi:hypothetical protein